MAKIFVVFFACLMDLPCYNLYHVAVVGLRVLALSIVKTQINAFIYLPIYLLFLIYLKKIITVIVSQTEGQTTCKISEFLQKVRVKNLTWLLLGQLD